MTTIIALLWLACGALSYAISLAYFFGRYSCIRNVKRDREDRIFSATMSLFGPLNLIVYTFCLLQWNGWKPKGMFRYGLRL